MADQEVTLDMLPPTQRELAEVLGLDVYVALVRYVNGDSIYIPKYDSLFEGLERLRRDEEIIGKFNGWNIDELAKEYNLTTRSIYNIIPQSLRDTKRNGPCAGQISLFDEASA